MDLIRRTITLLAIVALFSVAGIGILGVAVEHHEAGCPFMDGLDVMCPMSALEHLSAWQKVFRAIMPLLLAVLAVALICARRVTASVQSEMLSCVVRSNDPPHDPMRPLYSDGILNPKAP